MARRNKSAERDQALARIRRLVAVAEVAQRRRDPAPEVRRYVRLARRIAMRYQVSLPVELRRRVCRQCDALLVSGATARHRVANGRLSVTCLVCGEIKRYPVKSPKKVAV